MTGWLVYRCEVCVRTTYVNASHDVPVDLCCDAAVLVDVTDHRQFCQALRRLT